MYDHLPPYPGDPILSLHEQFQRDPRTNKASLSIGLYFDEAGRLPILDSVQAATDRLAAQKLPSGYLPIEGAPDYRAAVQALVFGADHPAVTTGRIATIQGVGGSGAIHIAARMIRDWLPNSDIWLSDPTWDNHGALCASAGLRTHTYPYYDPVTNGLRLDQMLAAFRALPAQSVVLMQPCCHNPTGIDPTHAEWAQIIDVFRERGVIPFLDMAYQGFGDGLGEDTWAIRAMVDAGLMPIVTNSFSKNFSLYGERVGGLSVVCPTTTEAELVLGQLKVIARSVYSSPALHGDRLVATVLGDAALRTQWADEVDAMRTRIRRMRGRIAEVLGQRVPGTDVRYFTEQRGMFSYTGLRTDEVDELRDKYGVYLVRSGRMCVAGLNEDNVDYVADSMAAVLSRR